MHSRGRSVAQGAEFKAYHHRVFLGWGPFVCGLPPCFRGVFQGNPLKKASVFISTVPEKKKGPEKEEKKAPRPGVPTQNQDATGKAERTPWPGGRLGRSSGSQVLEVPPGPRPARREGARGLARG